MNYVYLPNTKLKVSDVCLGTMTFGEQNTEEEAHQQLDYAVERGVNFIDTAEIYPVAVREQTCGLTEKFIGTWLKKRAKRDDVIIATKIGGPSPALAYIRQPLDFSPKSLDEAIEKSLRQLQTDYIDLYQIHWPDRVMNRFGKRGLSDIDKQWEDNIHQILSTLATYIKVGKIKHIGVSNENPWGVMRYLQESEQHDLPRIVTIQNPYSLLNRLYEVGLSEMGLREKVGLLAYSPLGFGVLTGKYLKGMKPHYRSAIFPQFSRFLSENCTVATKKYVDLANSLGISPTALALAFVKQQTFVSSTIIGATTLPQLKENIDAFDIVLTEETISAIDDIHEQIPNPGP